MKKQGKLIANANHSFVSESGNKVECQQSDISKSTDVGVLQAEIKRLKKALAYESLRADVYDEMINVAEQQFGISIRKKAGAK